MNFILPLKEICVQWDQDRSVYLDISFILNHAKCFPNCGVNNLTVIHLSQPGLGLTPLWLCKAYIEVFRWPWWLRQSSAPSPKPHPPLIIRVVTQWSRPAHWPCWKLSREKKLLPVLAQMNIQTTMFEKWKKYQKSSIRARDCFQTASILCFSFLSSIFLESTLKVSSRLCHLAWIPVVFISSPTLFILSCPSSKTNP